MDYCGGAFDYPTHFVTKASSELLCRPGRSRVLRQGRNDSCEAVTSRDSDDHGSPVGRMNTIRFVGFDAVAFGPKQESSGDRHVPRPNRGTYGSFLLLAH